MEKIIEVLKNEIKNLEKIRVKKQKLPRTTGVLNRLNLEIEGLEHACDVLCDWWNNASTSERQLIISDVTKSVCPKCLKSTNKNQDDLYYCPDCNCYTEQTVL